MPVASLRLPATPDQVRTARLVAAAAARRSGVPEEQLDEVRLAVGEATARAVLRHTGGSPAAAPGAGTGGPDGGAITTAAPADTAVAATDGSVEVTFRDGADEFTVEVRDGLPSGSHDGAPAQGAAAAALDGDGPAAASDGGEDDLSLALIEALPDRVEITRDAGGEVLTLVWLLPAVTGDDEPGPHAGPAAAPA